MKYKELISQTDAEVAVEDKDLAAEKAEHELNGAIILAKGKITDIKSALLKAKRAIPLNVANIREAQKRLVVADDELKQLKALKLELF